MFRGRRRGSVIVLAIAVLALLFIIGSTLLLVSNQQRQMAEEAIKVRDMRAIHEALTNGVMIQLRGDVVGQDGGPYDGS